MFLQYYGMREHPFGVTPNPRYLYLSPTHREALASLIYGIEVGRGFMALIAKPGMGKTTLLFQLLERLRSSARTVFLFHTQCDSREFFRYLLSDMGIDSEGQDLSRMHAQLNQVLLAEARADRRFVLAIDEAQNLDESVLETVRLLSDFETPRAKLMQIILAGQPQLAEKLAGSNLAQLRQRISVLARLEPFSFEETQAYIEHRLKVAGYAGPALFTPEALEMIAARGKGIPRDINNLCFSALSLGFALGKKKIDPAMVREVLSDLDVSTLIEEPPAVSKPSGAGPAVQQQPDLRQVDGAARPTRKAASVPYRSTRLVESGQPALRVGTLAAAAFVTACFLVFFLERAKLGENLPLPQTVRASNGKRAAPTAPRKIEGEEPSPIHTASAIADLPVQPLTRGQTDSRPSRSATETAPQVTKVVPAQLLAGQRAPAPKTTDRPLTVRSVLPELPVVQAEISPSLQSPAEAASSTGAADSAERSSAAPTSLTRVRVGSQAQAAKLISQPKPEYPAPAKSAGVQGTVRLEAVVGKDGTVEKLRVLSGHPLLVEAAVAAVGRWRYQPTLLNGNAVEVVTEVDVEFAF